MSWCEAKVHKRAAAHLLQHLCFGDLELAADGVATPPGSDDGFQVSALSRPDAVANRAEQAGGEAALPQPGWMPASERVAVVVSEVQRQQEQRMNELLATLADSLAELSRLRERVLKNSTEDMLRLALAVAEQVIHCEVKADSTIILATLQEALQAAISSDAYHVKVHPDDLALVMEKKPLFLASVSGLKNITLEADEAVSRGGCLIESELGQVDASIEGQLGELKQKLLSSVGSR
jgi:flagellar assembly protein FliH